MWSLEDDPRSRTGVAAVLIVDRAPDMDAFRSRLEQLVAAHPRLRSTVTARPRPLATYRWLEHSHSDLDKRLSVISVLDHDGGLMGIVAGMLQAPYGNDEYLWDVKVVHDLPRGGAAIVVRLHHCITDGLGAMAMAAQFFDLDGAGSRLAEPPAQSPQATAGPDAAAGRVSMIADSLVEDAKSLRGLAGRLATNPLPAVASTVGSPWSALRQGAAFTASTCAAPQPDPAATQPFAAAALRANPDPDSRNEPCRDEGVGQDPGRQHQRPLHDRPVARPARLPPQPGRGCRPGQGEHGGQLADLEEHRRPAATSSCRYACSSR